MTHWIVIAIKAPAACKTRLRAALGDDARERLVAEMLHHVVAECLHVDGVEVLLLGPHRHGLPDAIRLLEEPGEGLNCALVSAMSAATAASVDRVTIISADLPHVTAGEIRLLQRSEAAIAPDRDGVGTNALSLPLPAAMGFRFHYGEGSFARHFAEAEKLGLAIETVRSAGLALDIDTPKDLADSQNITGHLAARTSSTRSAIIWSSAGRRAARLLSGSGERLWSEAIAGAE